MARAIKISSVSGALTVTITGPNGGTPTVYADSQLINTLSMPATVADTATTTFWLPGPGKYTLSVKTSGGTEIAGDNNQTRSVDLETDSSVAALNYDARTLATVSGDSGHSTAGSAPSGVLNDRGNWTTGTAYIAGDVVTNSNQRYSANTVHTASALFATDAAKWTSLDPGPAASLSNATPLADSGSGAAGTAGTASRGDHAHPAPNLPPTDGFLFQHRTTDTTGNNIACSYDTGAEAFISLGRGNASPCYWTRSVPVKIGLNITTAAALSHVRLIVWDSNGTNGNPGTLIADLGQIDSSTTGRKFSPSSFTPTAYHKYWVAGVQQDATGVQTTSVIKQPWVLPEDGTGQFDAQCLIISGQTAAATSTPTIVQPYQGCFWYISQLA